MGLKMSGFVFIVRKVVIFPTVILSVGSAGSKSLLTAVRCFGSMLNSGVVKSVFLRSEVAHFSFPRVVRILLSYSLI